MLKFKKGDLLESDCTVIMHQANCFLSMGAGIAKAIAEKFPLAQIVDKNLPLTATQRYGHFSYSEGDVTVVNLYAQFQPGPFKTKEEKYERLHMLHQSISNFFYHALCNDMDLSKVGVPYNIGCGISGGDWEQVRPILEELSEKYQVDIYVYVL